MARVRIGWIGCGTHATEMLLPQLVRNEATLVAVCDLNKDNALRASTQYNVLPADTYDDWRKMLEREDLDAIGISAGPVAHYEIGKAVMQKGLALFMEKPPALTAVQADELAALAKTTGKPAFLGLMKRYSTANRVAINTMRTEDFGTPASFSGQFMTAPTYFSTDADYTGFFLHHCIHYMDLVQLLMGPVAELTIHKHELSPGRLIVHSLMRFENGALGTLILGNHHSRGVPTETWQVQADHRKIEVRNIHEVRYSRNPPLKATLPEAAMVEGEDTLIWEPNLMVAAAEDHKGYLAMLNDFVGQVQGTTTQGPTLADGARAMHLLEKYISA
ncbi:Gfo/Idh/MocA family oxidoreductase [Ahrensia kielensis]|uniref:Gfo/Idh/MocA family oxidoreductase n=1 Tax=Ahrensia kielensis TaxID=76980 RepID=A0ABU9T1F7_9HYPH